MWCTLILSNVSYPISFCFYWLQCTKLILSVTCNSKMLQGAMRSRGQENLEAYPSTTQSLTRVPRTSGRRVILSPEHSSSTTRRVLHQMKTRKKGEGILVHPFNRYPIHSLSTNEHLQSPLCIPKPWPWAVNEADKVLPSRGWHFSRVRAGDTIKKQILITTEARSFRSDLARKKIIQ